MQTYGSNLKTKLMRYLTYTITPLIVNSSFMPLRAEAQIGCDRIKEKIENHEFIQAPSDTTQTQSPIYNTPSDSSQVKIVPKSQPKRISSIPIYEILIGNVNPNVSALPTLTTQHNIGFDGNSDCGVLDFTQYRFSVLKNGKLISTLTASNTTDLEGKLADLGLSNPHVYFGPMSREKLARQVGSYLSNGEGRRFTGGNQQWKRNHLAAENRLPGSFIGYILDTETDQAGASLPFYVTKDLASRCLEHGKTPEGSSIQQAPAQPTEVEGTNTKLEKTIDKQIALERASVQFNDNCNKKGSSAWKWVAGIGIGLGVGYLIYRVADNGDITIINTNINNNDNDDNLPPGWGHEEDDDHDGVNGPRP